MLLVLSNNCPDTKNLTSAQHIFLKILLVGGKEGGRKRWERGEGRKWEGEGRKGPGERHLHSLIFI